MMQMKQRTIIWLLIFVLVIPAIASAAKGRLIGKVVDPEGKPIEGVKVTATCEELLDYNEIEITNKKGIFKLDFNVLFVVYDLRFEKAGYYSFDSEQDWQLEGTARDEFIMHPGQDPTLSDVPLASTSNEAIQAFNEGVAAFKAKDWAGAAAKFEESVLHDHELHQGWAALSHTYLAQKDYQKAVETAEKAVAFGSTDEAVLRTRWEAYRYLGDKEKIAQALIDLEQAGLRTEEARRVHNEAVALEKAGDMEGAFAKFQEALVVDPNLQASLIGIATTGIKIGRNAEAAKAAELILNADPKNEQAIRANYNACLALADEDKLVKALQSLALYELDIARNGLLKLALDSYYEANDMAQAKERFGRVLAVDETEPHSHYYLGLLNVQEGANEEAKKHLQRFIELAPDSPEAANAGEILGYLNKS